METSQNLNAALEHCKKKSSEVSQTGWSPNPKAREFTAPKSGGSYKSADSADGQDSEGADRWKIDLGPGPQPLRGISAFPTPQPSQSRNNPLSSARLPNGKLGTINLCGSIAESKD